MILALPATTTQCSWLCKILLGGQLPQRDVITVCPQLPFPGGAPQVALAIEGHTAEHRIETSAAQLPGDGGRLHRTGALDRLGPHLHRGIGAKAASPSIQPARLKA